MARLGQRGLYGKIVQRTTVPIVQGSDAIIVTEVLYKDTGYPYEFPGYVGSTGYFQAASGSGAYGIIGTLESQDCGQLKFDLSTDNTDALAAGEEQSFELHFSDDAGKTIILMENKLYVSEGLFG